jgi:hypothetical protein
VKSRPPTPDGRGAPPAAHLRLKQSDDGRWTWCWVQTASGAELSSNTTYASRDGAVAAAGKAYPELSFEPEDPSADT